MMKGMVFAERYKLEDFIGQGGMSLVYRAVDIRTGHSVAVKILKSEYNSDKEFLERFQREAQAASLMSHHNLVNLLDVGVEGEYRYLVLEYVNGNTLKDIIRQKGRLNYQTAIQITIRKNPCRPGPAMAIPAVHGIIIFKQDVLQLMVGYFGLLPVHGV